MLWIAPSREELNSASVIWKVMPSMRARENEAIMFLFLTKRALASARGYLRRGKHTTRKIRSGCK